MTQGHKGLKGKGDTGAQGPKGGKGDTGAQGPKGDKGGTGAQGPKGGTGAQGPKGDKGDTGAQGPKGNRGLPGSGGLSDSGFTMQGNINMNNNKITNLPDPTLANDPITKQYATRVYLTDSGFTLQDNISMGNHEVLGLNPNPSDGTAAESKDFTNSQYVKKNTDIDMNNNRILNLPFPQTSNEPVTKVFAETHHLGDTNIMTFKGKPGNVNILHKDGMIDTPGNGRATQTLDFSKVGSSYQINFSVWPKLPNGIYSYEMNIVLTTSRGYNIALWGDCGGSGYNASTEYNYWSPNSRNKAKQDNVQGGYFQRATGKMLRIKGSFLNEGTQIFGQEITSSLDYEKGGIYNFNLSAGSRPFVALCL